jgi:hypothetical protein
MLWSRVNGGAGPAEAPVPTGMAPETIHPATDHDAMTADTATNTPTAGSEPEKKLSLPSREEIERQVEKARVAHEAALRIGDTYARGPEIFSRAGHKKFNCMSLRDWLTVARKAWVYHVPALLVANMPTDLPIRLIDHYSGDEIVPPGYLGSAKALMEQVQILPDDRVVRFDCCSPSHIKSAMGNGTLSDGDVIAPRSGETGHRVLELDDARLLDILADYPQRTVPVWQRPWIAARRSDGTSRRGRPGSFSNEWRVFVSGSQVTGISNYYPQVRRTDEGAVRKAILRVHSMSMKIIETLQAADAMPHHPIFDRGGPQSGIHCTLDFLEAANGSILLIDGGPPCMGNWGAHPCCFLGRDIEGVALGLADGISF